MSEAAVHQRTYRKRDRGASETHFFWQLKYYVILGSPKSYTKEESENNRMFEICVFLLTCYSEKLIGREFSVRWRKTKAIKRRGEFSELFRFADRASQNNLSN